MISLVYKFPPERGVLRDTSTKRTKKKRNLSCLPDAHILFLVHLFLYFSFYCIAQQCCLRYIRNTSVGVGLKESDVEWNTVRTQSLLTTSSKYIRTDIKITHVQHQVRKRRFSLQRFLKIFVVMKRKRSSMSSKCPTKLISWS